MSHSLICFVHNGDVTIRHFRNTFHIFRKLYHCNLLLMSCM